MLIKLVIKPLNSAIVLFIILEFPLFAEEWKSFTNRNDVHAICKDNNNNIIIVTTSGIYRYNVSLARLECDVTLNQQPLPWSLCTSVITDHMSNIWMHFDSVGVVRVKNSGQVVNSQFDDATNTENTPTMVDITNNAWLNTTGDISSLNDTSNSCQTIKRYRYQYPIKGNSLGFFTDGTMIVGSQRGAFVISIDSISNIITLKKKVSSNRIIAIATIGTDAWMATPESLLVYKNGRIASLGTKNQLLHESFRFLVIDRYEIKWLLDNGGNIYRYVDGDTHIQQVGTVTSNTILKRCPQSIYYSGLFVRDSAGIFVASNKGLKKYTIGKGSFDINLSSPFSIQNNDITNISIDVNENVWVGTTNTDIMRYDGHSWQSVSSLLQNTKRYVKEQCPSPIVALLPVSDGTVWFSPFLCGLQSYHQNDTDEYSSGLAGIPTGISCLAVLRNGGVLIGTGVPSTFRDDLGGYRLSLGLFIKDVSNNITNFTVANSSLPSNRINCITVDSLNQAWIGTDKGLCLLKDPALGILSYSKNPILSGNVTCISTGLQDTILIGIANGVYAISMNDLKAKRLAVPIENKRDVYRIVVDKCNSIWLLAGARYVTGVDFKLFKRSMNGWVLYDMSKFGLPSRSVTSIAVDQNNNKWFGTQHGVWVYNENKLLLKQN